VCDRNNLSVILFRLISLAAPIAAASTASAALVLNVDHVALAPSATDQTVSLDVYLVDTDGVNERLNDFFVTVRGPSNTPGGVRFALRAALPSEDHPYVFERLFPGFRPPSLGTDDSMSVGGFPQGVVGDVDVSDTLNGLFSIPVVVPGGARPGDYPVVVDPALTGISATDPSALIIGPPGGVTVVPEPAALAAACLFPMALLQRRR
jgi:hypothetical protein